MPCNTEKCKELILKKKGNETEYPMLYNIKQHSSFTLLRVMLQGNCKFSKHIKIKLIEANKCLYIIRSLRKEGYTQEEIDHLFDMIVLPKLLYGLSVFAASSSDLAVVQDFLNRCNKRHYTTVRFNISELLEKSDRRIFSKIKDKNHPVNAFIPDKESS